jgi:ribonuclease P protein subunit POP4
VKRRVPRVDGPAKRVAKGELIGLPVTVVEATDSQYVGLQGTVIDETLHTLTLRLGPPGSRRMQLPKVACIFQFEAPHGPVEVDGRALEFRPEDRTKKVR